MTIAAHSPALPSSKAKIALAQDKLLPLQTSKSLSTNMESFQSEEFTQSWKDWFEEHGRKFLLFARQQTRSTADAEDVLQNAILRVWKGRGNRGQDRTYAPTLAEVYTAIRRAAIDLGRKNTRRERREQAVVADTVDFGITFFSSNLENQELQDLLSQTIAELPEKFRSVLTLKIWGEQTFAEIGETLNIPLNTAASRYRYALTHLRKKLASQRTDFFENLD